MQPKVQEWAILNEQLRKEYDNKMTLQKERERQRKVAFKEALDRHVQFKTMVGKDLKEDDVKYRSELMENERQFREQEEKRKLQKYLMRKEIEQQNQSLVQYKNNSSFHEEPSSFQIGKGRDQESRLRYQYNKKKTAQDLNYQMKLKQQAKEMQKYEQMEKLQKDYEYQRQRQQERDQQITNNKKYSQNMKVFNYYKDLEEQKRQRDQRMQQLLVDTPAEKIKKLQEQRIVREMMEKEMKMQSIRDSLTQQIEKHNSQKNRRQDNRDDYSYKMIDKIFQDKKKTYDKNEYYQYLRKQEQEQKIRKNSHKYMSDEQYKLNIDRLNKAVNGEPLKPNYTDRSPVAIGNPEQLTKKKDEIYFNVRMDSKGSQNRSNRSMSDRVDREEYKEDLNAIRQKIQTMKGYNVF